MEDTRNRKIITVSCVTAAFIAAIVVRVLVEASTVFGVVARLYAQDWFKHGLPIAVGVTTFSLLMFHPRIQVWADEVVTELLKVVWPTKQQTTAMTVVVCIMLAISAVVLAVFDFASSNIIKMIIN